MNNKLLVWILAFLSLLMFVTLYAAHRCEIKRLESLKTSDTVYSEKIDTLWKRDTFKITKFIPKEVIKTKVDTVFDKQGNEIELAFERKVYNDTVANDGDTANVTVHISGIQPKLDSLSLVFNRKEINTTQTIEITKKKQKTFWSRFNFGLQVGYGIGVKSKEFEPYVGIGFGVNL